VAGGITTQPKKKPAGCANELSVYSWWSLVDTSKIGVLERKKQPIRLITFDHVTREALRKGKAPYSRTPFTNYHEPADFYTENIIYI
jgi:hypothetical protein